MLDHDENSTHVKIGIAIRKDEIHFNAPSEIFVRDKDAIRYILPSGHYSAKVIQPTDPPKWGCLIDRFRTEAEAEKFADILHKQGAEVDVHTQGFKYDYKQSSLNARVWAVVGRSSVSGDSESDTLSRNLEYMEYLREAHLLKFDDAFRKLDNVRLQPASGGTIRLSNFNTILAIELPAPLTITLEDTFQCLSLADVRIGIDFHWDHTESLEFRGMFNLVADGDKITVVNELPLDDYLASLLGSEMRTDWPEEALAAQAIAARSTVLATRGRHHYNEAFDLCHDDHCQCYQGIEREGELARKILARNPGAILAFGDEIADARYSKSCGGIAEAYSIAWEDWSIPYMAPVVCGPVTSDTCIDSKIGFADEAVFQDILNYPPGVACNPKSAPYPASCEEMSKLYRWQKRLSKNELNSLIEERIPVKIGYVQELQPLQRGESGRIAWLRFIGTDATVTIGKELFIRRALSPSHLPSSAFIHSWTEAGDLLLDGLGWGHGVGMCQLGSAGLASIGWDDKKILNLYYPGTRLVQIG